MKDPIGSFETIKENFIRYIKTAFKTKFESLEKEREALLNVDKVLYREPWIEVLPEYLSSDKYIKDLDENDLPGLTGGQIDIFRGLVRGDGNTGLANDKFILHAHQAQMLRDSLGGKHCVITSGTGSGKTESFLLPLFAQLAKELLGWNAPNAKAEHVDDWWRADSGVGNGDIVDTTNGFKMSAQVQQRAHENRPSGMRAMILYPMNALVEDQMTRLRIALDSNPVRDWLNTHANGNSIYFGRYNGATPIPGKLHTINDNGKPIINSVKIAALNRELRTIETNTIKVERYITENNISGKKADELRAFFQRLDGAEMRCRFDMQANPPDILITNFSMLSIMLMREIDNPIFEKTRHWLACKDLPEEHRDKEKRNRIFHLVIDELHLYRGTQGTEVAYLLRLVLKRLGLHPNHPQLKILASSASLEFDNPDSLKYISDFFGFMGPEDVREKFEIIPGEDKPINHLKPEVQPLPTEPFAGITKVYIDCNEDILHHDFEQACINAGNQLRKIINSNTAEITTIEGYLKFLLHPELYLEERMFAACRVIENGKGKYRPVATFRRDRDGVPDHIAYYFEKIFGIGVEPQELRLASRGLLISRALFDESKYKRISEDTGQRLPRYRFHYFIRNIEGLWASIEPSESEDNRTVGKLYSTPRIKSEEGRYRVLELLYCDNCGTTFFGGSKGVGRNGTTELLPVDPNIEGIPEKSVHKLVEKRSYQEYAVFWPQGNQDFTPHDPPPNGYWRQVTVNGHASTDFRAQWKDISLNKFSGDVEFNPTLAETDPATWLKGKLFVVEREATHMDVASRDDAHNLDENENLIDTHRALPCVCPGCGVNEQYRVKFSPVRGFRTGFAKTTQLLAKELVYQIPEIDMQRKLVVFSDSREDAAQIANGIERNHFTELLREIIIQELHDRILVKAKIIEALDRGEDVSRYIDSSRDAYYGIDRLLESSRIDENHPDFVRRRQRMEAITELEKIRQRIIKVEDLVSSGNENCAPLIERFIKLGVNPGGPSIDIQTIPGTDDAWFEMFDFENKKWIRENVAFRTNIEDGTFINLASLFFGNLFYSLESSGLGYLTIDENSEVVNQNYVSSGLQKGMFCEVLRGSIRIIGHSYKYYPNDFDNPNLLNVNDYSSFPAQFKKYIRTIANNSKLQEKQVGQAVLDTLIQANALNQTGILIRNLYIRVARSDDPVWISPRGKRPHLHRAGGVCTQHPETTQLSQEHNTNCEELWRKNYLAYHAAFKKRKSIRLHCEELTGQTDDQFQRQRHFRGIILQDEGQTLAKEIDLLSVTTTLEVGVDIGALQSVMLANMPPQRFNYQQRVGRAGRRGQVFSAILTFCRGRSHDEFYFSYPHKITGDPPPTPFLAMQQPRILKRLIAKEVLRQAFQPLSSDIQNHLLQLSRIERNLSVHGEFGKKDFWIQYKEVVENWLTNNREEIQNIISTLKPNVGETETEELTDWVMNITEESSLITRIDAIIQNDEIATDDISEKLAEGGVLPMFGMPTSVRNLYHEIKFDQYLYSKSIDRSNDLAIYEFAPGAQKTKDKAIHTSIGFTDDLFIINRSWQRDVMVNSGPFYNERWMIRCKACGNIETRQSPPTEDECAYCGEPLSNPENVFPIKSPKAYRTDLSRGRDSKENTDILLSRPPILAEQSDDSQDDHKDLNNFHVSIRDKDISWRVNTNADNFFIGKTYRVGNKFPFNPGQWFNLSDQWILEQFAHSSGQGQYVYSPNDQGNELETIALAAHKNTEVFRLHHTTIAEGLNLNMFDQSRSNSAGVRSGIYSAAFLLQRVLADKLDVDPTEIELADVRRHQVNAENLSVEMILTDELPNGSGFVRYLYDNLEEIISECITVQEEGSYLGNIHSEEHRGKCKDACYDCLKVFKNMNYHGLLDWRLGTAMLRTLNNPRYVVGADGRFSGLFEIDDFLEDAKELGHNFASSFDFELLEEFDLPVIASRNRNYCIIVTHPFWDCHVDDDGTIELPKDLWITERVFEVSQSFGTETNFRFIDTFNLQRRPGWCYQKLFQ